MTKVNRLEISVRRIFISRCLGFKRSDYGVSNRQVDTLGELKCSYARYRAQPCGKEGEFGFGNTEVRDQCKHCKWPPTPKSGISLPHDRQELPGLRMHP